MSFTPVDFDPFKTVGGFTPVDFDPFADEEKRREDARLAARREQERKAQERPQAEPLVGTMEGMMPTPEPEMTARTRPQLPEYAPVTPEEQMVVSAVERGLPESRQRSVTETLPKGAPVSERPLQMPARSFSPQTDRVDALMLGLVAEKAKEELEAEPPAPIPTIQAARQAEQQRQIDAAIDNAGAIVLARQKVAEETPEQSVLREVADVPIGVAKGVVGGVGMLVNLFGADSAASRSIKNSQDYLNDLMSAQAKNDQKEIARIMAEAEGKGVGEEVKAAVRAFATAPVDFLSEALGTTAPAIAAALGASVLGAGALGVTAVAAATGAGMGAGVVKGTIYDETKKALLDAGMKEDQAEARASLAQQYNGQNLDMILSGAAIGGLASVTGVEKALIGPLSRRIVEKSVAKEVGEEVGRQAARGVIRTIATGAVTEALPETLQAAQEKFAANLAVRREGLQRDLSAGVAGAATLEGLAGSGLGAGVSAATARRATPEAILARSLEGAEFAPIPTAPTDFAAEQARTEALRAWQTQGLAPSARTMEQVRQDVEAAPDLDSAIATAEQAVAEVPTRPAAPPATAPAPTPAPAQPVPTPAIQPEEPEITNEQLLTRIRESVGREPVETISRVEPPRIQVPPTGRVELTPEVTPEVAPRIQVPPTGRVEAAPVAEAPPVQAPPTEPAPEVQQGFDDFLAPRDIPSRGVAKGEVVTFPTEKQALAYAKEQKVPETYTPREVEGGFVLSQPARVEAAVRAEAPTAPRVEAAPARPTVTLPAAPRAEVVAPPTGAVPTIGEERAIQKPSPEAVSVLPRTEGGQAVGERDTQRQRVTGEGRTGRQSAGQPSKIDPSPEEAIAVERGVENKPIVEAADWIAENATQPDYKVIGKRIARRIRELEAAGVEFGRVNIARVGDKIPKNLTRGRGMVRIEGSGKDIKTDLWLNGSSVTGKVGTSYYVSLHELAHAATAAAIRAGADPYAKPELARAVKRLNDVHKAITKELRRRNKLTKEGRYAPSDFERLIFSKANNAFANPDETIAWSLTKKEAQDWLESVPYKGGNLWTEFVTAVRTLLGLPAKANTALSEVLSVAEDLMTVDARAVTGVGTAEMRAEDISDYRPSVVNWAKKEFGDRVAPNGNPVWENFVRWFGDSQVVNERGEPLVVYHTTPSERLERGVAFEEFDEGVNYFSTKADEQYGDFAYPVYLSIKNPYDFSKSNGDYVFEDGTVATDEEGETISVGWLKESLDVVEDMIRRGFDGAIDGPDFIVSFDNTQIKSSVGNNGNFGTEPSILENIEEDRQSMWFSELSRQIEKGPESMPAAQWKGWIANQKGIKKDEVFWTGINDFLDLQTGKVSKQQIQDFLKENGVRVGEVTLGGRQEWHVRLDLLENRGLPNLNRQEREEYLALLERRDREGRLRDEDMPAKFQEYTLPGGENYREVLLTLPTRLVPDMSPEWRGSVDREVDARTGAEPYRSQHWEQPNILAHIRVNDRTDADGKRVLFVEEIQSDWGQEGKKKGFRKTDVSENIREMTAKDKEFFGAESGVVMLNNGVEEYMPSRAEAEAFLLAKQSGIPAAPFVTKTEGWLNLALKRIMIMAAEGGYDRVAFINGEQSADRYDLSKQVSRVYLSNMVFDGDTEQLARATIVVTGRDGIDLITEKQATPARIEEIIGKEAARRLISSPSNTTNTGTPQQVNVLEGDGLKVGGEGMKTFYDQIVPAAVKKLLPKVGGGVVREIPVSIKKERGAAHDAQYRLALKTLNDMGGADTVKAIPNNRVNKFIADMAQALVVTEASMGEAVRELRGEIDDASQQPGFDVTPQLVEEVSGGMSLFQIEADEVQSRPVTPALDDAIRKYQDRNIDIKRIIDSFKEKAGTLLPAFNPYLQEGLSRDRKAAQEKAFEQFELLPMLLEMAKRKVSLAELEDYLHARHAPDYNKEMAKRNPNKEQLDQKRREIEEAISEAPEGSVELERLLREKDAWAQVKPFSGTEEERNSLSGMSTKEAEAHINNLPEDKRADIESLAEMVDKMVQKSGDLVIDSGADPASIRNPNFRFYVPLKREGFEESGGGYGQGFSVTGKFIRTATGSRRKVVDILANISEQRIRAINRAENNRVANALLGFVLSAPNPELWSVDKIGKVARLDKTTGAVVMRPDPEEMSANNIIVARVPDGNGGVIERKIVFNPDNKTSFLIVNAFRRNDTDGVSEGLAKVAILTRWFANMSTQYNPIFGGVNFIRDLQSSAVRLTATPLAGKQAELIGTAVKVIPAIYKDLRARRKGERRDSQYADIFKEFEAEGGRTLLRTNWEGSAEKTKELQKIIQRAGEQSAAGKAVQLPGKVKDIVADWLTDYNDTLESAIRLSAYKMAREQGISKPEAAMIAKDITVNFSRKGTATDNIGALYAFFNASVQGTANMANTLDVKINKRGVPVMGRRGQKIVAGGVLLGVIQGLLYSLADYEEGEPPEFIKEKNLVIPFDAIGKIGEAVGITQEERSNKYFSIPLALGYNFFPNLGRIATELALGGFKDPGKKAGEAVKSAFDAFSPIGAAMSLQLITPTAADPIVALMENKDWTGKPIYRESFDRFASEPGFKLARDNASFAGIYISRALNYMSGGTEYSSGVFPTLLSPTPDQIDYLIGQAFGGIGRELTKIQKTAAAQVTGEELPAYSVPVVSRFFGEVRNQASHSQAFYDNVKLLIKHEQELKGREEAGEDPNEYMAKYPEAEISDQARRVMREVQQLRKEKREKVAEGIPKEEVREYDEEITQIMAQFNDEVRLLRSLK